MHVLVRCVLNSGIFQELLKKKIFSYIRIGMHVLEECNNEQILKKAIDFKHIFKK